MMDRTGLPAGALPEAEGSGAARGKRQLRKGKHSQRGLSPKKAAGERTRHSQENFYTGSLPEEEVGDSPTDLPQRSETEEIVMLRVMTRRLVQLACGTENPREMAQILKALSFSSASLSKLLEQQRKTGKDGEVSQAISSALTQVIAEFKLGK